MAQFYPTNGKTDSMADRRGSRNFDRAALLAAIPLIAVLPLWAVAMVPFWLVLDLVVDISYLAAAGIYVAAGLALFVPVVQRVVLTRLIGARRPTAEEAPRLQRAFDEVAQALHVRDRGFALGVVDDDDVNAFASGGHLVVVTSYAARHLDHDALCGVIAHEFCHHLGSHTIALTMQQWLMLPVTTLARLGAYLRNVALAASDTFARSSGPAQRVGRVIAAIFNGLSWFFEIGSVASHALSNVVGRSAEFRADQRVISMGYGRQLAEALRRTTPRNDQRSSRWSRLLETHPPARTRIARIEGTLRRRRR
jgi:Zn-dependent protease with chaperone function